MIGIIDYGMGNLKSVLNAFKALGYDSFLAAKPGDLKRADKIVLPGVGAFEGGIAGLRRGGWDICVKESAEAGIPIIGICLGMQLMFEKSFENGSHDGLGLFPGCVDRIPDAPPGGAKLKIPQVGWNNLELRNKSAILSDSDGAYVYFVHSYYAVAKSEHITSATWYGAEITASAERRNIFGVQFHPEKSGKAGLGILKKFAEYGAGR